VARIVELRRAGRSYPEIATALDAEGHKPREAASWSAAAVRNVALREIADWIVYSRKPSPGAA
jgi:hypothetical protein